MQLRHLMSVSMRQGSEVPQMNPILPEIQHDLICFYGNFMDPWKFYRFDTSSLTSLM